MSLCRHPWRQPNGMCVVRCCCRFPRQLEVAKELPAPGICVLLRLCAWYRRRWGRRRSFELEEFLKGGEAKVRSVLTRYYLAKKVLFFFERNCMKNHLLGSLVEVSLNILQAEFENLGVGFRRFGEAEECTITI